MKEKIKKAAFSFVYRSIICLCLFTVLLALDRFVPQIGEKCVNAVKSNIDLGAAGESLSCFLKEILQ
ncbi:MAG: hypothetical protein UIL37_06420 [Clostridia bacterium]|nr:hypothetical protein [Clostridia bacterium]